MIELLVVIAIIGILAALLLPALAQAKMKAQRAQCVSDLKQIGIAFHNFLHDHNSLFPMQVSTNDGGTLEYMLSTYQTNTGLFSQFRHFQVLSNDLVNARTVFCPSDKGRLAAADFRDFNDLNLSYFIGANASYNYPNSIVAGDRNVTDDGASGPTAIVRLNENSKVSWTGELHQFKGNLLFADGHVSELNGTGLRLATTGAPEVADIVLPSINSLPTSSGISGTVTPISTGGPGYTAPPMYQPPVTPGIARPMPAPAAPSNLSSSRWSIPLSTPATSTPSSTMTYTMPRSQPSAPNQYQASPQPAADPAPLAALTNTNRVVQFVTNQIANEVQLAAETPTIIVINPESRPFLSSGNASSWLWLISLLVLFVATGLSVRRRFASKPEVDELAKAAAEWSPR